MKKNIIALCVLALLVSCKYAKEEDNKLDSFYTEYDWGGIKVLPLLRPIKLHFNRKSEIWYLYSPEEFNVKPDLEGDNIDSIGFDKMYFYGKLSSIEYCDSYVAKKNKFVYAHKNGSTIGAKKELHEEDLLLLKPIDSTKLNYIVPARWFVVDTAFNAEVFFEKAEYLKYLKEQGISGELHHPDEYFKEYSETGVLPWFPDSIKEKVRK